MKILFDGYWLSDGPISNAMVQRQIIENWAINFPQDEIYIAVRSGYKVQEDNNAKFMKVSLPLHALSVFFELPWLARKIKAQVVLTHNFSSPAFKSKTVVFIHDFIFMEHPKWFTLRERAYFALMPMSSRFASLVFTSSSTEAARISRYLKRPVIPTLLGISPHLNDASPRSPDSRLVSKKFMLTIGRLTERKNLLGTIESALDTGLVSPREPIVVVGEKSGKFKGLSPRVVDALRTDRVILLDNLGSDELAWLYVNCSNFLFFSLDEGYGLPAIEALYFGSPIKLSDITVFRELVGGYGVFANPESAAEMTEAISSDTRTPKAGVRPPSWLEVVTKIRSQVVDGLPTEKQQ
jgi:glycosyltransferase involved in cell wall biosynthesis